MTASIWTPGSTNVAVANPNAQIKSQIFSATEGQTSFTLTNFTYHTGGGALEVYVNGSKLPASYVDEVSSSSFSLTMSCEEGDIVEAVGNTEMASADSAAVTATTAAAEATSAKLAAQAAHTAAEAAQAAAQSSETNALAAKVAAETVFDDFDDRFLGSKSSAPALDNDGNAILTGALYWNSTTSAMYVFNGTAWKRAVSNTLPQTLTDGATVNWDWDLGNAKLAITASRTLANPTNMADGEYRSLRVSRSGTFVLTFGSKFRGTYWIIQSAVSGQVDHFVFRYDAASDTVELVGYRANVSEV